MLEVIEVGGLVTLQDAGRPGWRRFGVPLAGPMDRLAFEAANLLVGNPQGAAVLEIGAGDITLRARHDGLIAVSGAGFELSVNVWTFPLWGSYFVRGGWSIRLAKHGFGMWAYLAAAGGFDVPPVLGSRSTYLRGHFGGLNGRSLQPGDVLHTGAPHRPLMEIAGRTVAPQARPAYGPSPIVDVIAGPQSDRFTNDELAIFTSGIYRLSASSDRMGYRLEGPALRGRGSLELTSEGMAVGSIQVPPGGQPIVMMADCATTGGYPKIACVTSAALPLLAQCAPGRDEVRFRETSVAAAQAGYRSQMDTLTHGIVESGKEF
jgi:antagonist of KipI